MDSANKFQHLTTLASMSTLLDTEQISCSPVWATKSLIQYKEWHIKYIVHFPDLHICNFTDFWHFYEVKLLTRSWLFSSWLGVWVVLAFYWFSVTSVWVRTGRGGWSSWLDCWQGKLVGCFCYLGLESAAPAPTQVPGHQISMCDLDVNWGNIFDIWCIFEI